MSEINVTLDELLAELEKLSGESLEGFTTEEMSKRIKRSVPTCRAMLRVLVKNGKAKYVGRRRSRRIDGATFWIPVYQFVGKKRQ